MSPTSVTEQKYQEISNTPFVENICKCLRNPDRSLPHAKAVKFSYGLLEFPGHNFSRRTQKHLPTISMTVEKGTVNRLNYNMLAVKA